MERGYHPAQYRVIPAEKVRRNHQQNADTLHDVKGYVPILSHRASLRTMRDIAFGRTLAVYYLGGVANHDRMGGDVEIDEGKGSDQNIVSNRDVSNYTSIAPDPDIVADGGIPFSRPPELHADGDALVQGTVPSKDGLIVYGDIATMDQDESLAYPGMPTDLDARLPGTTPEQPSGQERTLTALIQTKQKNPLEIRFPDGRIKQTPDSPPPVISVQVCKNDIWEQLCHYS